MKSFFDELFSVEGDIFQDCPVVWPAFRLIIITSLFEFVRRLEKFMIMDIPVEVLEEVTEVIASVVRNGVRVDWMDEALGRIATKRRYADLLEKTQALEDELLELDRGRDEITQTLSKIDADLIYNNLSHQRVTNYPMKALRKREWVFFLFCDNVILLF